MAPPDEDGLEKLLRKLPPAPVLFGAGLLTLGGGAALALQLAFPLALGALPVFGAGLALLVFGAAQTRSGRRLRALQRRELEAAVDGDAERVFDLLGDGIARPVQAIAEACALPRDVALRALGTLSARGLVVEEVDLETGDFVYAAAPDEGDTESHLPLSERLQRLEPGR